MGFDIDIHIRQDISADVCLCIRLANLRGDKVHTQMSSAERDRNRKFCLQDDLRIRLDIHAVHVIGLI